ncbi:OTU domain-containing protein 3-like [Diadema setosum]|uniref:OTU domain-containing protein 3-like n=1 Tax=Diadema setosum TaxID=31175 RepID=UPI003B3B509E
MARSAQNQQRQRQAKGQAQAQAQAHNSQGQGQGQGQVQGQGQGQNKPTKSQRRDALERKRDERAVRSAYRKMRKDESYLAGDQNFLSFTTQLQAIGLQLRDIPGDGNCLFRALGDQLEGHGRNHMAHRLEVVQYMKDHKNDFEPFMEDDTPFDRHLSNLSKPGTYAGNDSIVAFARNHGVNVIIHQLNLPVWKIVGDDSPTSRELHISYHNGDHYSSVRRRGDSSEKATNFRSSETSWSSIKGKAGNNSKTKSSDAMSSQYANGAEDVLSDIELNIMDETGCQDVQLIRETLEDCDFDVDATVGVLLQIIESQWDHESNDVDSGERSPQGAAGIWSSNGSGTRIFGFPDEADGSSSSSSNSKTQPNRTEGGKGGKHVQNGRKSKSLKKQEKKQRQMERHRQRLQGDSYHSNTTNSSDEESGGVVLVGQMGALSI